MWVMLILHVYYENGRYLYLYPYHNIHVAKPEVALMSFVNIYLLLAPSTSYQPKA